MNLQKKMTVAFLALVITMTLSAGSIVQAQTNNGILPRTTEDCSTYKTNSQEAQLLNNEKAFRDAIKNGRLASNILGCAIKLGKIRLYMMPFFVTYLIEWLLGLAGLISVMFVVIGGYRYVIGGISEDKESGKKTIMHALVGLIIALSAWIIVNFVQVALTS